MTGSLSQSPVAVPAVTEPAPDQALFLEMLTWYVEAAQLDLEALISLLMDRYSANECDELRLELPLDLPEVLEAESAVIRSLGRQFIRKCSRTRWDSEPGRNVDWCQTYLRFAGQVPEAYANVRATAITDVGLLGGLRDLATRWARLLRASKQRPSRIERARALEDAARAVGVRACPWNEAWTRRLARFDPQAAERISKRFSALRNLRGERLARQLRTYFETAFEPSRWEAKNGDLLFETTSSLLVARAATSAVQTADRTAWSLGRNHSGLPAIELERDGLRCRISKGRPRDAVGRDIMESSGLVDELSHLVVATGNHATGGQPDLVITFWRANEKTVCVTYLGDAKRNIANEGRSYLYGSLGKSIVYAEAYKKILGAWPVAYGATEKSLHPKVTLFFYQACQKLCGVDTPVGAHETWQAEVVEKLQNLNHDLPATLSMDLRHVGLDEAGVWRSAIAQAWFDRLTRQAVAALNEQHQ